MLKAECFKHTFHFKRPSGTSRGVLKSKESWFVKVWNEMNPEIVGIGECSLIYGLSPDSVPNFGEVLEGICNQIDELNQNENDFGLDLLAWPSISFGLQNAFWDLEVKGSKNFDSNFARGKSIPINGLIWMGEKSFMKKQIDQKLKEGFSCIKLKIGAINFTDEVELLKYIRKEYTASEIELRVDANGGFSTKEALEKLKMISDFQIHSIEQPIMAGQYEDMASLCEDSPLDIALDEELIGPFDRSNKKKILEIINPQYIILKPSLHGGFLGADEWIDIAESMNVKWWATSALESNIGLNAIAQWVEKYKNPLPQGLGTGGLFENNIDSPLYVSNGHLSHYTNATWDLSLFNLENN
ncbi:MAG: o-succinylbenzoate synthase [Parvicellaceae bacterium]|jgi:o-succinylbenzoate synthase